MWRCDLVVCASCSDPCCHQVGEKPFDPNVDVKHLRKVSRDDEAHESSRAPWHMPSLAHVHILTPIESGVMGVMGAVWT